jgi:hypothetical protein
MSMSRFGLWQFDTKDSLARPEAERECAEHHKRPTNERD